MVLPLRSRGTDLGVLAVFDRLDEDGNFGQDDLLTLESFASSAASALLAARALADERISLSIASSERERERWARELHDETLQELGALTVAQESALQADDPGLLRSTLESSKTQVESIILGLQGLITELRPAALDQLGIEAAIEALVTRVAARSDLQITADVALSAEQGRHAPELEATIYRLVQESLTNVVKHADASRARIRIEEVGDRISVTVEDDGAGFDSEHPSVGFGLVGMRERVELHGGELEIASSPGKGTRVTAELPVERVRPESPH
jgi:signal transduction histidine kinase